MQSDDSKDINADNSVDNESKECEPFIIDLPLSPELRNKNTIESITLDMRADIIKVVLSINSTRKTIVSTIHSKWRKTIDDLEKQAKRKNVLHEEIMDIINCLDDNSETIIPVMLGKAKTACNYDNNNKSKQQLEILKDIELIRSNNSNITVNEWRNGLVEKYNHLHYTVNKYMPNLWPALECELSVQKILNIKDCTLPFAGIILGPPSSLKTQVIELLRDWPHTFYTDNFSAKSFVSHTTAVPKEQLVQIDLLPKIKNKCFLTPELAPTFAAKDDDLVQILGIMTRILDGNGYESDSGAQGHRGYSGKTMFTWVGAAVDISPKVHKYLGTLGPKLYFYRPPVLQKKTESDYLQQIATDDFNKKVSEIREALLDYLKWFEIGPEMIIDNESGLTKMPWNCEKDDKQAQKYIIRMAGLLAHLRGVVPTWNTYGTQGSDYGYALPTIEQPDRAIQQLTNLAKGHALLTGRNFVTLDDIPLIIGVVLSTASKERVTVFDLLLAKDGVLTASDISLSLNMSPPTAHKTMLQLWVLELVDEEGSDDIDTIHRITLKPKFKWFTSREFRELRVLGGNDPQIVPIIQDDEIEKEKNPLSGKDSLHVAREATFWNIYDKLEEEQKGLRKYMEIDKTTVSGQELKQRLVSSGMFYPSDAVLIIAEMVTKGELKEVVYDTYARVNNKTEIE